MVSRLALGALLLLLLLALPASAGAATFAKLPVAGPATDVGVSRAANGELVLRFGPGAAKRYRSLARGRASWQCTDVAVPAPGRFAAIESSMGGDLDVPKRRGRLRLSGTASDDLCVLATPRGRREGCIEVLGDACLRLVVATSGEARTHLDEVARSFDLLAIAAFPAFGAGGIPSYDEIRAELPARLRDRFVALPGPDAATAPDTVGYWTDGSAMTVATLTAAGVRRFFRADVGGALASNAYGLLTFNLPEVL